jgi:hypothetical protein
MTTHGDDSYLWDGTGEPDPAVVRLERLLEPLRQQSVLGPLPPRARRPWRLPASAIGRLSTAAVLIVVAAAIWFAFARAQRAWSGWAVQTLTGAPRIDRGKPGVPQASAGRLATGEWLVTDALSRARISVGRIGRVDVEPNTRLQLVDAGSREQHMSLARGTIHARIWAPPRLFFVQTPSAMAVDLGCEYTLQVDDAGAGLLRVTSGWVGFEGSGRSVYIPEGALGATRPGVGPGTPYYDDAPSGYGEALSVLDFADSRDPRRGAALDLILSSARRRDALTLWHLLSHGSAAERARVFDRLTELAPPPRGVTRGDVLAGNRRALDQWWDSLGINNSTWWKLWKKKM